MTEADLRQYQRNLSGKTPARDGAAHLRGKAAKRKGQRGEDVAEAWLRERYDMVTKIPNHIKVVRKAGRITGAYPAEKVCTDFFASERGTGRLVLCEVKARSKDRLNWSDIEEHQRQALTDNPGVSLLLWVRGGVVQSYDWHTITRSGFEPGASIKWED